MIKLFATDGSSVRTERVELANAETHIAARDHLANEAKCLLAWLNSDNIEDDPIAWDGSKLIYSGDIGDAEPVVVIYVPGC